MDLETYLENKKRREARERDLLESYRVTCSRCLRPENICLCPSIKSFDTRARFLILMHPKEARKEKNNTGRLTFLHLKNSRLLFGVNFSHKRGLLEELKRPHLVPFVLYPGPNAADIKNIRFKEILAPHQAPLIILIDGTWNQARKIMKLSRNIQALPRVSIIPPERSRFIIKKQPAEYCLSTIESAFFFLEEWQRQGMENLNGQHRGMVRVFEKMVKYQLKKSREASLSGYRRSVPRNSNITQIRRPSRFPFFR
ncbi:MAG: DTW domain-containing protein [Candidatus Aminicenantes bacterium]|nr:DTW domain-containing protein [Candidatus Aminicenantes bacterium]